MEVRLPGRQRYEAQKETSLELKRIKKSALLDYELFDDELPLTNPADLTEKLEEAYIKSSFNNPKENLDTSL